MAAKTTKEARVNVRMEQELYDDYATAARVLGVSVPDLMRDILRVGQDSLRGLIGIAEQAKAGDTAAAVRLMQLMLAEQEDKLQVAAQLARADVAELAATLDQGAVAGRSGAELAAAMVEQATRDAGEAEPAGARRGGGTSQ